MKKSLLFPLVLLFASSFIYIQYADGGKKKYSKMVWSDEFNSSGLPDSTKWSYDLGDGCPNICGWGNNELEYYTVERERNARVENGNLIIELHNEPFGGRDYTSARLTSKGKGDWLYGRFEIRAKLPVGKGTWPAIWMLPSDKTYGDWPHSGEIDIMEKVGYDPDTIVSAAHTLSFNAASGTHKVDNIWVGDNDEEYHTYILEWDQDEYRTYVDDRIIFTYKKTGDSYAEWPFDKKFHLILNIAYGGNWGGAMGLEDAALPTRMEIDYVRVYQ